MAGLRVFALVALALLAVAGLAAADGAGLRARLSNAPPLNKKQLAERDSIKMSFYRLYLSLDEPGLNELLQKGRPEGIESVRTHVKSGWAALRANNIVKARSFLKLALSTLRSLLVASSKAIDADIQQLGKWVDGLKAVYGPSKVATNVAISVLSSNPVTGPAGVGLNYLYSALTSYADAIVDGKSSDAAVRDAAVGFGVAAFTQVTVFKINAIQKLVAPPQVTDQVKKGVANGLRVMASSEMAQELTKITVSTGAKALADMMLCQNDANAQKNAAQKTVALKKCSEIPAKSFKAAAVNLVTKKTMLQDFKDAPKVAQFIAEALYDTYVEPLVKEAAVALPPPPTVVEYHKQVKQYRPGRNEVRITQ